MSRPSSAPCCSLAWTDAARAVLRLSSRSLSRYPMINPSLGQTSSYQHAPSIAGGSALVVDHVGGYAYRNRLFTCWWSPDPKMGLAA